MDNSSYLEIRALFNKFLKKDYWQQYTAADIFFIHDIIKNKESFLTFIDSFYGDSFGIQLFNNKDGFNYVHDLFTSENPEYLTVSMCDSICAVYVSKDELKDSEIAYLKKRNIRLKKTNNLLIYRFKKGYAMTLASELDEIKIFKAIELLDSLLRNDKDIIDASFKEELCAYADVNTKRLEYTLIPRPLPYLETISRRKKENLAIIDELNPLEFVNDEAYLFSSYLPITISESKMRPLAVYLIYPNIERHYFGYIIDKPDNICEKLFTIIYDAFTLAGKPVGITFSSRDLYAALSKTLNAISIECKVDKNKCNDFEGIHSMLRRFYTEELCESEMPLSEVYRIMDSISATINTISYTDSIDSDYDDEDNIEISSEIMVS